MHPSDTSLCYPLTEWSGSGGWSPSHEQSWQKAIYKALKTELQLALKPSLHKLLQILPKAFSGSRRTPYKAAEWHWPYTRRDRNGRAELHCPWEHQHWHVRRGDEGGWHRKLIDNTYQPSAALPSWPLLSPMSSLQHLWPQDLCWQAKPSHQVFWILLVSLDQNGE